MKYAYHATRKHLLTFIKTHGLTPGSAPSFSGAYSEYDDGKHLFFSEDDDYLRGYGGADVLLRFPWPSEVKPDQNTFGRILPHQFVTTKKVPPTHIEVEEGRDWVPLGIDKLSHRVVSRYLIDIL